MIKSYLIYFVLFALVIGCSKSISPTSPNTKSIDTQRTTSPVQSNQDGWKLIFVDEFTKRGDFDSTKWDFSTRGQAAWARYLTDSKEYASQNTGSLVLRMDNKTIPGDEVPYHSGGIQTKGKFNFKYGKVEVRAKFDLGRGSWPAIWMMPETPVAYGNWPNSGEIDIMEHVNLEPRVHQTIHNGSVTNSNGVSTATMASVYNENDYNTYAIIWEPKKVEFYINNVLTLTYDKPIDATPSVWPFDKPFYIILNQSGGAGWPGPITDADLPFEMLVDYVRVYKKDNN